MPPIQICALYCSPFLYTPIKRVVALGIPCFIGDAEEDTVDEEDEEDEDDGKNDDDDGCCCCCCAMESFFLSGMAVLVYSKQIAMGRGEVRINLAACLTVVILVPLMTERQAPRGMLAACISGQTLGNILETMTLPCSSSTSTPSD